MKFKIMQHRRTQLYCGIETIVRRGAYVQVGRWKRDFRDAQSFTPDGDGAQEAGAMIRVMLMPCKLNNALPIATDNSVCNYIT